jgi:hypothetical protein
MGGGTELMDSHPKLRTNTKAFFFFLKNEIKDTQV